MSNDWWKGRCEVRVVNHLRVFYSTNREDPPTTAESVCLISVLMCTRYLLAK